MIASDEIYKRIFIWGVAAVAVIPRQHIDLVGWSVGGDLSHSFRKLLLGLIVINFLRLLMKDSSIEHNFVLLRDVLGIVQQLGNSFLCFLSSYILQTWLANVINLGGRPGSNLKPTLYASTVASILAAILARRVHSNFWGLRRFANAISSIPVVQTLKTFNTVTTRGGNHEGRGSILSQTLMTVEYWYVAVQLMSAIGFAMNREKVDETTQLDELWAAFREASFMLDWIRILSHAIFINQLDELYLTSPPHQSDSKTQPTASSQDLIPLVKQSEA
eukprot:65705_1